MQSKGRVQGPSLRRLFAGKEAASDRDCLEMDTGLMSVSINLLQLDKLLSCQELESGKGDRRGPVHDEHLFIVVHQGRVLT